MANKVNGSKVACTRKVKGAGKDPASSVLNWTFDFENCPQEKILSLATDSLVIIVQRNWRNADAETRKAMMTNTFEVAAILTSKRAKKTNVQKVKELMKGMSQADRDIVMKAHNTK